MLTNQIPFDCLLSKNSYLLTRGHDFVEIGGIKWATCNVGAEKPTDPGWYFAWGETKGYTDEEIRCGIKEFTSEDYRFMKRTLDVEDDPVYANWGDKWRLPTAEEFRTLLMLTRCRWIDNYKNSGVSGFILTDKTDRSKVLFFPAAGYYTDKRQGFIGCHGSYWCSSTHDNNHAYYLYFNSDNTKGVSRFYRFLGYPVRGVIGQLTKINT